VAFLIWIAVPSGGGVLANFAAGFPVSSATAASQGPASSPGQGAQLASNGSGLDSASTSADTTGTAGDNGGLGSAAGDNSGASAGSASSDSGSVAPDAGSAPSTPGGPTTPSQSCPVPFPATGTPLDGVAAQVGALCAQLLAPGSGTVPAGALPGGSAGNSGAGASQVPTQWLYLDAPVGASGAPNTAWSPALAAEMAGRTATVPVGLVQGATVSPALAGAIGSLVHDGVLVQLLLVPEPTAAGGPAAFGSWVTQVLAALQPVQLVEIGTGAAPRGSNPATVAADTVTGLAAARAASGHPTAGVVWLDDGTAGADPPVWSALDSAQAWSLSSFVARSLDAAGACTSPAAFAATLRRDPVAAKLPVVSEAVQAPAPAGRLAADLSCVKASVAPDPGASVAMWRLWEGPVPR
jgi:hypothetical protein